MARQPAGSDVHPRIFLGLLLATVETMVRRRQGIFAAVPADRVRVWLQLSFAF